MYVCMYVSPAAFLCSPGFSLVFERCMYVCMYVIVSASRHPPRPITARGGPSGHRYTEIYRHHYTHIDRYTQIYTDIHRYMFWRCLWGPLGSPWWVPGDPCGDAWGLQGCLGGPSGSLKSTLGLCGGALGIRLGSPGVPWGFLGVPEEYLGALWGCLGDPLETSGVLLGSLGTLWCAKWQNSC